MSLDTPFGLSVASSRSISKSGNRMYCVRTSCLQASFPKAQAKYVFPEPVKP